MENSKCNRIIERLENVKQAKDLISIAEQVEYQNFQLNRYGSMGLTLEDQQMRARYNSIIIAMEGKIIMEEYGDHFTFFEKLLRRSYSEFTISKLVRISIFG